ncbi:plasma membrane fusion protein prm1 [Ophidiomyces ophidiicola]|uniref:Plasma membrane fusion protein prm1 n=1 Tax=Ophidiomyces ophidiicola TaxID=1387563 RepID=A0ACB8V0P1_9EURO|nr:plasma membrane fusion protein prm1 [Ophidiomyces ophidiicola]KAI1917616.1 plasma membrane fusion protein prm1 [Ophidiomyces ophidiicola]KAI1923915.1 plasma membrane fusion protein prm1 [Ophidiomyces ophidiicola]KAI1960838.1 plasma membrane fusion protein prm1 [Ophidiomyces ophidiicola]KAI1969774.1 plasma membrane fusion protein prm1 [Ophidiomyces ophidiicola]
MHFSRFIPRSSHGLPPYGAHDTHAMHTPAPTTAPPGAITPYLGFKARLSQIWINKWTILLLLVLVRLLIAIAGLNKDMASAKREALSACTSVESMGSAMASMPHYMSKGVNELTASGVEKAVNGLMSMLLLTVTGVEEIVVFVINVLTQTYVCLITLAVAGSLQTALKVIEEAADFLNKTLVDVTQGIEKGVNGFENKINDFLKGINTITNAFGGKKDPPRIDIGGDLDKLKQLRLPSSLDENLKKINNSIPTFKEVNNFTNNAIRFPFREVKKLINESLVEFKFDRSVFPVPQKEKLNFCNESKGINSFFGKLKSIISAAQKIFVGVLIAGAIAACVPMALLEIRRWRHMKERALLVQKNDHDPMDVVYIVSRPYTSTAGLKIASWFKPGRRQVLVRWIVAYVTSTPALFLLALGMAGLFSCACQAILLHAVKKEVPVLTNEVGQFADKVVFSLNNASQQWAISTNRVIDTTNDDINKKVFGWVNTTTSSLNNTLNIFVDKTSSVLNETFGGTVLHDPIRDVLYCLIGLKIQGIQKALTWVHNHARVDFPNLPNDTFSLGAIESVAKDNKTNPESFLANPGDRTADAITHVVLRVIRAIESGIRTEAIISSFLILLWVILLLLALLRALTLAFRRDKTRAEGGIDATYHPPAPHATTSMEMSDFYNVPLTGVPNNADNGLAPKYSTTPNIRSGSRGLDADEDEYQAQKLGYAGQRDYDAALQKDVKATRRSSYGQVVYSGEKKDMTGS